MSFILDALRKSENERQQQASPQVSVAAVGAKRSWQPGWIALAITALGAALLAVGIVWALLKPQASITAGPSATRLEESPTPAINDTVVRNLAQEARRSQVTDTPSQPSPAAAQSASPQPANQTTTNQPLTVIEAMANGLSLPHLNLDIHVYAPQSDGRFVFINANKYREGETLREGPQVEAITSDGVVLKFQGQRLLLPRD